MLRHAPFVALLFVSCGGTSPPARSLPVAPATASAVASAPEPAPPDGRLAPGVQPTRYALELTVVPGEDRFSGRTQIEVTIDRPRRTIWMHGRGLHVTEASIVAGSGAPIAARFEQVDPQGLAALRLDRSVGPGAATIRIGYDAPFNRSLEGLYRVDTGGDSYAFTQFEPVRARMAFPCFDEPGFKTPFDLRLTVRRDHVVIANTRPAGEEPQPGDMKRVRFGTTPPLPTYLVAFAVGPLDVVEAPPIAANDVRAAPLPFRGLAARGRGARLRWALERTPALLSALERYLGVAYPYDKLDLIAVPDFGAGAMENAGAITYRETLLLVDGDRAPEDQRRGFTTVTAHELAHQWFGDLVTLRWWDDTWLNEAFATWMAARVVAAVAPENRSPVVLLQEIHGAMGADSLTSARRIREPIVSHHDIPNAFDAITYLKGAGVVAMFERWMGPEVFQRGVRLYLARHRFGTATAPDLLAALAEAAGRDVATPFGTFLDQPGVPRIETRLSCERGKRPRLALKQARYLPLGTQGERNRVWQIPVCARTDAGQSCTLLSAAEGEIELLGDRCPAWVLPNADGAGYYRFSLAGADLAALRDRGWSKLSTRERIATADSLRAGFADGSIAGADVLAALVPLAADPDRAVATAPIDLLRFVRDHVAGDALRPRVTEYVRRLYGPAARRLAWTAQPGESGEAKLLRRDLLVFLAITGRDPAVRREAARRGREILSSGGAPAPSLIAPELIEVALAVALQEGDDALFDRAVARLAASDDALLRQKLLAALGSVEDAARAARARALAFDPRVRINETMAAVSPQIRERPMREAAWGWVKENFDRIVARLGPTGAAYLPYTAAAFCDAEHAADARGFFGPRVAALEGAPRNLARALEAIDLCAARVQAQGESARGFFAR